MRSKSFFSNRAYLFQRELERRKLDLFFIDHPLDIFYLTGIKLSKGVLWVHPSKTFLFIDGRYIETAKKTCPYPVKSLCEEEMLRCLTQTPWKEARKIGFDSTVTSYAIYSAWRALLHKSKKKRHLSTPISLRGERAFLQQVRILKEEGEICRLKKSAKLLWEGYEAVKKQLKVGVKEKDLALTFEIFCRKKGAEALSFEPIIAFGENSAFPHHHVSSRALKKGDVILIDIGVKVDDYCSDMTRTLFFGDVSHEMRTIYSVVRKAHEEALKGCRPKATTADLYQAARKVIADAGYEKFFPHGLGHGVGLEVHEQPFLRDLSTKTELQPGMVFTIEPGIYLPGKGGVRYEDTIVITERGYQNFYKKSSPNLHSPSADHIFSSGEGG